MAWEWRRNDRAMVLECLQHGDATRDAIATTSQGALDELAHLTAALGVWDALAVIQAHREREGIPDDLLLRTLTVLPFIEAVGQCSGRDPVSRRGDSAATGILDLPDSAGLQ